MKKEKIFSLFSLLILFVLSLTACSQNKNVGQNNLPSPQVILSKAQNTNFKSLHANWLQTDQAGKTEQKAEVKYQKSPTIIHGDFTTNSNHYQLWTEGKYSYIQTKGTATNRWFKTKSGKASSFAELTDDLARQTLMNFSSKTAKMFKVTRVSSGYQMNYSGNNKKLWDEIIDNTMITSVIGLDPNTIKPQKMTIKVTTDKHYNLTDLNIEAVCHDGKATKKLMMEIDQINKLPKLTIPRSVTKSAVDLGSSAN